MPKRTLNASDLMVFALTCATAFACAGQHLQAQRVQRGAPNHSIVVATKPSSRSPPHPPALSDIQLPRPTIDVTNTDEDPNVLAKLTIVVSEPNPLRARCFSGARSVFRQVLGGLASHAFAEQKKPACLQAIVTDAHGAVRAFTHFQGSDDSFAEVRHFFDTDGALRLLLYVRNDVAGGSSEDLVAFDPAGTVVACKHIDNGAGLPGPDLCIDEQPEPKLDPEVERALNSAPAHQAKNQMRDYLQGLDPKSIFQLCAPLE